VGAIAQRGFQGHIGQEVFMDAFWLIPVGIVVIAFLWGLFAYLKRQPDSSSKPRVLVDKPGGKAVDETIKARDWSSRPCGSVMDWRAEKRDKPTG
jgi:hypothetical protein